MLSPFRVAIETRFRDLDAIGHVNNAVYLTYVETARVGYWLQVQHGFILGDALSRVAAAQSVLFSRDPHLAAIGFIFTPLASMVQMPAIGLSPLWPDMTARAFSGTIMSALFMAGAVVQILGMGTNRTVRLRRSRLAGCSSIRKTLRKSGGTPEEGAGFSSAVVVLTITDNAMTSVAPTPSNTG